jgi:hypothetical protein
MVANASNTFHGLGREEFIARKEICADYIITVGVSVKPLG